MNVFGIGPTELLLIVILALIVFGPQRLPEIMGQVGKAINDFRRATSQLSDEFNRTIQTEFAETRSMMSETKSTVMDAHAAVSSAVSSVSTAAAQTGTTQPARTPSTQPAHTPSPAPVLNGSNTNGADSASNPPLADTSQWSWETAAPPSPAPTATAVEPRTDADRAPPPRPVTPHERAMRDDLVPPY